MRIAHTGDVHLGLSRYGRQTPEGNSRVADFAATLGRFADAALERKADVAVLAGDTFHTRTPGPQELAAVSEVISRLYGAGIEIVLLPGNHDGMTTIGDPRSHALNWLRALDLSGVHVYTTPTRDLLTTPSGPLAVVAMPYPHKRAMDLVLPDLSPEERVEEASRRATAIIAGLADGLPDAPRLFVGHLTVVGGKAGSERAMRFGWDVSISPDVFEPFDYVALGHLHPQQEVVPGVWYAGSPEYVDFAESGQAKGFLFADVARGQPAVVESVPSGARPLGIFDLEQQPDGDFGDTGPAAWYANGPIIRARLHATHSRPTASEEARIRREIIAKGASHVETEVLLEGDAATRRLRILSVQEDAAPDSVRDLSPTTALRRWLELNDKPLEPAMTVGTELISAAMSGEGGPA